MQFHIGDRVKILHDGIRGSFKEGAFGHILDIKYASDPEDAIAWIIPEDYSQYKSWWIEDLGSYKAFSIGLEYLVLDHSQNEEDSALDVLDLF